MMTSSNCHGNSEIIPTGNRVISFRICCCFVHEALRDAAAQLFASERMHISSAYIDVYACCNSCYSCLGLFMQAYPTRPKIPMNVETQVRAFSNNQYLHIISVYLMFLCMHTCIIIPAKRTCIEYHCVADMNFFEEVDVNSYSRYM